jgi:hypothetical protein
MVHGMFLHWFIRYFSDISLFLYQKNLLHRYGNWGICFIYGTWFGLGGLAAAGKTYNNCPAMRRAVDFLLRAQKVNGGWGESYLSCPNKVNVFFSSLFPNIISIFHYLLLSTLLITI